MKRPEPPFYSNSEYDRGFYAALDVVEEPRRASLGTSTCASRAVVPRSAAGLGGRLGSLSAPFCALSAESRW